VSISSILLNILNELITRRSQLVRIETNTYLILQRETEIVDQLGRIEALVTVTDLPDIDQSIIDDLTARVREATGKIQTSAERLKQAVDSTQ